MAPRKISNSDAVVMAMVAHFADQFDTHPDKFGKLVCCLQDRTFFQECVKIVRDKNHPMRKQADEILRTCKSDL